MRETSIAYRNAIQDNRAFQAKLQVTLADGTEMEISGAENLFSDGIQISTGTSSTSSFDIGAAVIRQAVLKLNNATEHFSGIDFYGAQIIVFIGLELADGTVEWLRKGRYYVSQAATTGIMVQVTALGCLSKTDRPYKIVPTTYPTTLGKIVSDICGACSVALESSDFPNSTLIISSRPEDENLTCREMLSYVAQLAGSYVWEDDNGKLSLRWYKAVDYGTESDLDGGNFVDDSGGDVADGGSFVDYSGGDVADGGNYADLAERILITRMGSQNIASEDVEITGIRVKQFNTSGDDGILYGNDNYLLEISNNPLITSSAMADTVAQYLADKIIGMKFRPMKLTAQSDPSIEAGDPVMVIDRKLNQYQTVLTNITFKLWAYETFENNAKSRERNEAVRYGVSTKTLQKTKENTKEAISEYDIAIQRLSILIMNSMGYFETTETDENGGIIYYMHDKPLKSASTTIWKRTIDAIAVSTDGGQTWNAGVDANGNAVVKTLSAIGINANWINVGTLQGVEAILKQGTIGGWTLNASALYRGSSVFGNASGMYFGANGLSIGDMIQLSRTAASAKFGNSVTYAYLDSGALTFYRDSKAISRFSPTTWNNTDTLGTGVQSEPDAKFITFGNRSSASQETYITVLVLNYGLNPNGNTQDVQIYGDILVTGTIYNDSGIVSTSDRRYKKDAGALDIEQCAEFIYSLVPAEFKYKNGTSGRYHHGFLADEVKTAMGDDDWGLYVREELKDTDDRTTGYREALRYEELIADLVATAQSQNERISELEEKVMLLEKKLAEETRKE